MNCFVMTICCSNAKWSITNLPPWIVAELNTKVVELLFQGISYTHIAEDKRRVRDIGKNWSDYSNDILACLSVDASIVDYVKELIKVS